MYAIGGRKLFYGYKINGSLCLLAARCSVKITVNLPFPDMNRSFKRRKIILAPIFKLDFDVNYSVQIFIIS